MLGKNKKMDSCKDLDYTAKAHKIIEEAYPIMLSYAKRITACRSPEDVVQTAILIGLEKSDVMVKSPNPTGWLINTLRFCLKKEITAQLRADSSESLNYDNTSEPISQDPEFERIILLRETCLKYITEEDWGLLYDSSVQGFSTKDLSEKYKLSTMACRTRMTRARQILRRKILC